MTAYPGDVIEHLGEYYVFKDSRPSGRARVVPLAQAVQEENPGRDEDWVAAKVETLRTLSVGEFERPIELPDGTIL